LPIWRGKRKLLRTSTQKRHLSNLLSYQAEWSGKQNEALFREVDVSGDGEIDTNFAAELATRDPKNAVNQFCQRFCGRPLVKEDVQYTTQKFPSGFQATLKLVCLEGQEFNGELATNSKEAEKNAAKQALTFYADKIATMPKANNKTKKKRPAATVVGAEPTPKIMRTPDEAAVAQAVNSLTPKCELNSTVLKLMKSAPGANNVVYETHMVEQGFQSTVKLPGLPGEKGQQIWAGEVASHRKQAEQNAAAQALEALRADNKLMTLTTLPRYTQSLPEAMRPGLQQR